MPPPPPPFRSGVTPKTPPALPPSPLQVGRDIKDADLNTVRTLEVEEAFERQDPEHIALLVRETIQVGGGGYRTRSTLVQSPVRA